MSSHPSEGPPERDAGCTPSRYSVCMSQVSAIVSTALALRRSHPVAPPLDVLDLVMQGRCAVPADFGADGLPPAPFALLVADALDSAMTPEEWRVWTAHDADPRLRAGLLEIWRAEVWPRFVSRFDLLR